MNLRDIINAASFDEPPFSGKYKIPWDEPGFSARMLKIHLDQNDDLASRRGTKIADHVGWIDENVLGKVPSRLLDLACGPGLYSHRLATEGHECFGIDFSPASIDYASEHNPDPERCRFAHGDLRTAEFGEGYDAAIMIYGEFNAFPREEIVAILKKTRAALKPGGRFIAEAHTLREIEHIGSAPNSWYKAPEGLFSEKPHVCLIETCWHEEERVAEAVFDVVDAQSAGVERYRNTLQGYDDMAYQSLFMDAGFSRLEILSEWGKDERSDDDSFVLLLGER